MTPTPLRPTPAVLLLAALACARTPAPDVQPDATPTPAPAPEPEPEAVAELVDTSGGQMGVATFSRAGPTATLAISVSRLPPGPHGMHVHERGTCTPPGFESAGSHLNPDGKQHGLNNPAGPHAGDLPNLLVQPDSSADTTFTIAAAVLDRLFQPEGAALVIHADEDDQRTDPAGTSGARIACGVIKRH